MRKIAANRNYRLVKEAVDERAVANHLRQARESVVAAGAITSEFPEWEADRGVQQTLQSIDSTLSALAYGAGAGAGQTDPG